MFKLEKLYFGKVILNSFKQVTTLTIGNQTHTFLIINKEIMPGTMLSMMSLMKLDGTTKPSKIMSMVIIKQLMIQLNTSTVATLSTTKDGIQASIEIEQVIHLKFQLQTHFQIAYQDSQNVLLDTIRLKPNWKQNYQFVTLEIQIARKDMFKCKKISV